MKKNTRVARFIDKRIDELQSRKSQREIAREAGYTHPNIISMLKSGESKLPLDRVPALAKALEVDPAQLFRLALEQYFTDGSLNVINDIFGTVVTRNEAQILDTIREATNEADPEVTPVLQQSLKEVFTH